MNDSRINTYAALAVVVVFGIGAVFLINRAIERINWTYVQMDRIASGDY